VAVVVVRPCRLGLVPSPPPRRGVRRIAGVAIRRRRRRGIALPFLPPRRRGLPLLPPPAGLLVLAVVVHPFPPPRRSLPRRPPCRRSRTSPATSSRARKDVEGLCGFLVAKYAVADIDVPARMSPSATVDAVWHSLMLHPRAYDSACRLAYELASRAVGNEGDHFAYDGFPGVVDHSPNAANDPPSAKEQRRRAAVFEMNRLGLSPSTTTAAPARLTRSRANVCTPPAAPSSKRARLTNGDGIGRNEVEEEAEEAVEAEEDVAEEEEANAEEAEEEEANEEDAEEEEVNGSVERAGNPIVTIHVSGGEVRGGGRSDGDDALAWSSVASSRGEEGDPLDLARSLQEADRRGASSSSSSSSSSSYALRDAVGTTPRKVKNYVTRTMDSLLQFGGESMTAKRDRLAAAASERRGGRDPPLEEKRGGGGGGRGSRRIGRICAAREGAFLGKETKGVLVPSPWTIASIGMRIRMARMTTIWAWR